MPYGIGRGAALTTAMRLMWLARWGTTIVIVRALRRTDTPASATSSPRLRRRAPAADDPIRVKRGRRGGSGEEARAASENLTSCTLRSRESGPHGVRGRHVRGPHAEPGSAAPPGEHGHD